MEGVTRAAMLPLLDLQKIDTGIDRLNARKADLPEQAALEEVTASRDAIAATVASQRAELDELIRQQDKLEHEIGQVDERAASDNERLSGESNPREIANLQAELDTLRRRKSLLEDSELEVMEQRETLEAAVAASDAELGTLEAAVAEATEARDTAMVEIDKELGELTGQRETLVAGINAELIELYEDLRGRYRGVAVGALDHGTCRACGIDLSPVARDAIKRSDDPIIRCENCRRLLVVT